MAFSVSLLWDVICIGTAYVYWFFCEDCVTPVSRTLGGIVECGSALHLSAVFSDASACSSRTTRLLVLYWFLSERCK